jgi:hypothetical protein
MFAYCTATPVGKRYSGAVQRPRAFAASIETMRKQTVDTLARTFSDDVAQIINLFQNELDSPGQFCSMKYSYSNCQRRISVATQRLEICLVVDFVKRRKVFPATECTNERFLPITQFDRRFQALDV